MDTFLTGNVVSGDKRRPAAFLGPGPHPAGLRIRGFALLGLLAAFAAPMSALAQDGSATLAAGNGSGDPGDTGVVVAVSLSSQSGAEVSGLNFDLSYDAGRLSVGNVTIGGAASAAGKSLAWSQPSAGTARVIIFGVNQTAIGDGTVANVSFDVLPGAAPGVSGLDLHNAAATSPTGGGIPLSLDDGSFTVNAPPASPTSPATATPSSTASSTSVVVLSPTATGTSTRTPTRTATRTVTRTPSRTPTRTASPTGPSLTPSRTSTPSATNPPGAATATASRTSIVTAVASPTASSTLLPGVTQTPASATAPPAASLVPGAIPPEIETAAVATGTALAELELGVSATGTALAVANPGPTPPARLAPFSTVILFLVGLAAVMGTALAGLAFFLRRRPRG